ncbi:MAG: hypothetical protein ABSE28_11610 [Candidatus Sulfotelmatobacter sp.]
MSAKVFLDSLTPDDVTVESVFGRLSADGEITDFVTTAMQPCEQDSAGSYKFRSVIQPAARSGMYGYAIRALPKHPHSQSPFLPGLILCAGNNLAARS